MIPFTGSGSLFVRLGHLIGGMQDVLALVGGPATANVASGASIPARVINTISPDYANGTPIPQVIYDDQTMSQSLQAACASAVQTLANEAQRTLYAMANIDTQATPSTAPLATLTAGQSSATACATLVSEMTLNSYHVQAATVSAGAQTAVGSPNGNPTIFLSLKNPQGVAYQLIFPETLTFTCTRDSQSGGATLGNETLQVKGQTAVSSPLSPLWPGGSGATASVTAVTAGTSATANNNSAGNRLVNGAFLTYTTANNPDNWTILAGTAGTQVLNGSGTSYLSGGGSVEFVGNATGASIAQSFATTPSTTVGAGGTGFALGADQVYHGCLFYKLSAGSPAAGVLTVDLVDGSNTTINDDAGNANSAAVTLSGVSDTLWHALTFAFHTPAILPTTTPVAKLRIRLSTALSTGTSIYISNATFTQPTQLYVGGPWCSVHAGSSKLIAGASPDAWTIATSNNYQTSGTGLLQSWMNRIFGLQSLGLQLPITGTTQVADSLIA